MSRLPRAQEYLKTGFTAEAASAARFRAAARRAEREGRKNLAQAWLALAAEKDSLAILLLEAADRLRGGETELSTALAEERYENDALYPRMIGEVDDETAGVLRQVVAAQQQHLARLERLRESLVASTGDVGAAS